jgi:nitrate reductase NapE
MSDSVTTKSSEIKAFLFITVFLFPLLCVGLVGGYGFLIWMSQLLFGSSAY